MHFTIKIDKSQPKNNEKTKKIGQFFVFFCCIIADAPETKKTMSACVLNAWREYTDASTD